MPGYPEEAAASDAIFMGKMMRIHWGVTYFSDKPILPSEKRPDAFWRDVLEIFEIQPV